MAARSQHVLLYPCNIVGYVRLLMLITAVLAVGLTDNWETTLSPTARWLIAIWLFVCLLILDILDGYLARRFQHSTQFGALFELTLDLLTHTFVWYLSGLSFAWLIILIEWVTGLYIAAFTLRPDQSWKITLSEHGPWLVRQFWRPASINWLNDYSNLAHFLVPISLFLFGQPNWLTWLMLPGLIIYEVVTLYMAYTFLRILVNEATPANQ